MAHDRKTKTFVYKRAHFHETTAPLSVLLAGALKAKPTLGDRRESLSPGAENPIWRLIGEFSAEKDFVFGVLMRYMPGLHPPCLIDDETAKTVTVEQLAVPNTDDGKSRELVEGMLYFGAIDNHMVLMQSAGMRAKQLEMHLLWLLRKAGSIAETNTVCLNDTPTKKAVDALAEHEVRELDIGGELLPTDDADEPHAGETHATKHRTGAEAANLVVQDGGASNGILSALKSLMSQDQASTLDSDALTGSNIGYTLTIRYSRATTDDGQALMNTLGSALRHADGVSTTIRLVGGGSITGDELKLSGPVRITYYDGVPSSNEVFEEMRTWLLDKVKSEELAA